MESKTYCLIKKWKWPLGGYPGLIVVCSHEHRTAEAGQKAAFHNKFSLFAVPFALLSIYSTKYTRLEMEISKT